MAKARITAAALLAAALAIPSGLAVAQVTSEGSDGTGESVPAQECPAAEAFMESIGFGEQSYGTSCPTVEHLKDELTNPDPTVPSLDEMPGGQEWVEENDIPVIEVPE